MWRYLTLLGVFLFLALLIGGRDNGQIRQGLLLEPIHKPLGTVPAVTAQEKLPAPDVTMANFVPVAPPAPAAPAPAAPATTVAAAPEPAPEPVAQPVQDAVFSLADTPPANAAAEPQPATQGIRWVSANAINVREGPGTGHGVAGRLTRGEAVTVVADAGDGWVRIRIEGDGLEGFVASRLLSETAP